MKAGCLKDKIENVSMHLNARYGTYFPKQDLIMGIVEMPLRAYLDIKIVEGFFFKLLLENGFEMVESKYLWPNHWENVEGKLSFKTGETFENIKSDIEEQVAKYIPNLLINSITIEPYTETDEVVGQLDYELLGQASIYKIPGANTAEYTAKLKIDYTDENKAFGSREFVIINI